MNGPGRPDQAGETARDDLVAPVVEMALVKEYRRGTGISIRGNPIEVRVEQVPKVVKFAGGCGGRQGVTMKPHELVVGGFVRRTTLMQRSQWLEHADEPRANRL